MTPMMYGQTMRLFVVDGRGRGIGRLSWVVGKSSSGPLSVGGPAVGVLSTNSAWFSVSMVVDINGLAI